MLFAVLVTACFAVPALAQSSYDRLSALGPLPARVLVLNPEGFQQFAHTSLVGRRETVHLFGQDATEELRRMLAAAFEFVVVWPVSSVAEAIDMLSAANPRNAEVRGYDYVAIPEFTEVNSLSQPFRYRFEIDMILQFYATDGSTLAAIRGYGESTTGNFHPSRPLDAGRLALIMAVEAIRDGIEGKRGLFAALPDSRLAEAPVPPPPPVRSDTTLPAVVPIPVRVLMLIPYEFSRFVHTSSTWQEEADHFLGEEAEEHFRRILGPLFQYLTFRPATSETAARDMLSPDNPDTAVVKGYDYIGIPKFTNVHTWSDRSRYGVTIDMVVSFYSVKGSQEIEFKGYGDYSAGLYGLSSPASAEADNRALSSAVEAIRERIDLSRDLFAS